MRNTLKATTIENKLPLLAVENGCIVSKDADLTVAFEVTLPELYTVTSTASCISRTGSSARPTSRSCRKMI